MKRSSHVGLALCLIILIAGCYGDTKPPGDITGTSAVFKAWGVPETSSTVSFFKYGTTPQFGQETTRHTWTDLTPGTTYPIEEKVTGLTPGTRYYYTMCGKEANQSDSEIKCSNPQTFVTGLTDLDYQFVPLATGGDEVGQFPIALTVLPDRSVVHATLTGTIRVTDAAGNSTVAGTLPVYFRDEEGLMGIVADPSFATNRWLYIYYSPPWRTLATAPDTGTPEFFRDNWMGNTRLSRFTLKTDKMLDLASEKVLLEIPHDRGQCCHMAGDLDFDAAGNLYLVTGDDTQPGGDSAGYAPIDERVNRNPHYDAQRTSANTNDLRGKLLRIKPQVNGTYTIPSGNLFAPGTAGTRPEIYAMGFRNPFRMSVDKATGHVYLGDYGPDAYYNSDVRGPQGQVEFNRITKPGNFGWPYCTGANVDWEVYNEYTFPTGPSGPEYDCKNGPTNNSFRSTGLSKLPPAQPAWIKYGWPQNSPPEFEDPTNPAGERDSQSPTGGPVYRFDPGLASNVKFPKALDGMYFAGEFGRKWIKVIGVNPQEDNNRGGVTAFPWVGTQVMDMAFGPDGALYVLDYPIHPTHNNQSLYRIEYLGGGNHNPIAKAGANKTNGPTPLTVTFLSAGSKDPEGGTLTYRWDFGDGATSTQPNPSHTYTISGTYRPTLTVTDPAGKTGTASLVITVGNTAPSVSLATPGEGQLYSFSDSIPFQVNVADPEDPVVDCSKVKVTYSLGHDDHQHLEETRFGCTGSIPAPGNSEHLAGNVYGVIQAEYTDSQGLTSRSVHNLQLRHRQTEHFSAMSGVGIIDDTSAHGGQKVGYINNNDWISFQPYLLNTATSISLRVASPLSGGSIEIRAGSDTGTLLGQVAVPNTGSFSAWTTVSTALANQPSTTTTLYLVFKGPGTGALLDIDDFTLQTS